MKKLVKNNIKAVTILPAFALAVGFALAPQSVLASDLTIGGGATSAKSDEQSDNLFDAGGIFETVTTVLLFLIGAISVIMLIIGGIRYTISQGDSGAVTAAKNTILYSIVGILVALLSYAVVKFVIDQFAV